MIISSINNSISKRIEVVTCNRQFFMGIAMIMVVLYHMFVCDRDNKVLTIFYPGYLGVDIFLFLSGYGLCRSLEKHSLKEFYKRRFIRILPLFLIMAATVSLIEFLSGEEVSLWDVVCNMTTLSYWGVGGFFFDWYLCSLFLFYLSFPFLYMMVRSVGGERVLLFSMILCMYLCYNDIIPWWYQTSVGRIPIFITGIWTYQCRVGNVAIKTMSIFFAFSLVSLYLYANHYIHTYLVFYMFFPVVLLMLSFLVPSGETKLNKPIIWVGRKSLEIYVANVIVVNIFHFNEPANYVDLLYVLLHIVIIPIVVYINTAISRRLVVI